MTGPVDAIPPGAARGVLLDYGNVLAGVHCGDLAALVRAAGGRGDAAAAAATRAAAYAAHDAVLAAGGGHEDGWRALVGALVRAAWGEPVDDAEVDRLVDALWARQRTANLWRDVPPGALALVQALAAADVPVAVVSNAEGRARETVAEAGLAPWLPVIVDSALVGVAKPDPRIFALAAGLLALPPAALVHVGDSESADVAGALGAGMLAVRFDGVVPNARPSRAHAVARTYAELAGVLGRALGVALAA